MSEQNNKQLPIVFSSADYVSADWASKALGYSRPVIYQLLQEGTLVGHQARDNGWWRIRKDSVIAYLQKLQDRERNGG